MSLTADLNTSLLNIMVGGQSALETPKLFIKSLEEAYGFLKSYGFDIHNPIELKKVWYFHRRALVLMQERLLDPGEEIPHLLQDQKSLGDIRHLLLYASSDDPLLKDLQRWSCALLRVMHVFVHLEKDLFSYFAGEIQKQVLSPFQECVVHEGDKIFLRHPFSAMEIPLKSFEVKPFKTSSSSVIKMLAKPDVVALKVLDKLGVRFITETLYDSFRVALFLAEKNLFNFAHVMPDQSSNTIYPLNLFLDTIRELLQEWSTSMPAASIDLILMDRLKEGIVDEKLLRKENSFSDSDYRFIKFICRKIFTIDVGPGEPFKFFYPFEVQIVDQESHLKNEMGTASHSQYKERQRAAARLRVFPDLVKG